MDTWDKISSALLGLALSFALISYFLVEDLQERVVVLESQALLTKGE